MAGEVKRVEHPVDVQDLAFELWAFECDRNTARVARRLDQLLDEGAPRPHQTTVSYWARTKGWDIRADQAIAALAPHLRARQLGRLFMMGNQALDVFGQVLTGELDEQRQAPLQAKVAVGSKVLELLGLGTAAGRGEAPRLQLQAEQREDLAELSPQELARMQREALLERRGQRSGQN